MEPLDYISLTPQETAKLLSAGNGDAALVYLYIKATGDTRLLHAQEALHMQAQTLGWAETLLKQLGLTEAGAVPGLILISVASSGMGYYVCKGYFDTIPKSLDEAAILDGATRAQILVKMIIPLSKPIIIYTALVAFMAPWCDYIFASYVAFGNENGYNVAVAMTRWVWTNDYQGYFTRFCAGGILVAIPVTILFMCLQKYYVEGVTGGSVKG